MQKGYDKPVVAITIGDYNGIGPEIILKCRAHADVHRVCTPVLVGPPEAFEFYAMRLNLQSPDVCQSIASERRFVINPGRMSAQAGEVAWRAIAGAVGLVRSGFAQAMVTAPVSKRAMHLAGYRFPGQTETIQQLSASKRVAMMLVSDTMRIGLVTIHVPIKKVATILNRRLLREKIGIIHNALRKDWRIRSPKLAVLALNPHASEGGDIGGEDIDIVGPIVHHMQRKRMKIEGPFPADAFFGRYRPGMYDAIVAMYHDQGLIPLKMSSFGKGVNISVGLNIVRTSPDHGTAFDIAGRGVADPSSMIEAIKLAALVASNRGLARRLKQQ